MNSIGEKSKPPKGNEIIYFTKNFKNRLMLNFFFHCIIELHVYFIVFNIFTELLNSLGMNNYTYFHFTDPPRMPIVLSNAVYFSKTYRSTNLRKNQDPQSARLELFTM